jgi:ankyrin repeat protein
MATTTFWPTGIWERIASHADDIYAASAIFNACKAAAKAAGSDALVASQLLKTYGRKKAVSILLKKTARTTHAPQHLPPPDAVLRRLKASSACFDSLADSVILLTMRSTSSYEIKVSICKALIACGTPMSASCVTEAVELGHQGFLECLVETNGLPAVKDLSNGFLCPKDFYEPGCNVAYTPMIAAIHAGDADMVSFMLRLGFGYGSAQREDDESFGVIDAIGYAAGKGYLRIVQLLVEAGASVDGATRYTPLGLAARNRHYEVVCWLLSKKAAVAFRDDRKDLPLVGAVMGGCRTCIQAILKAGAPVNIIGTIPSRQCALAKACCLRAPETIRMLLEHGADPNAVVGRTSVLMMSVSNNTPDVAAMLLQAGADVDMVVDGANALLKAVVSSSNVCAEVLLRAGANPNAVCNGKTILMHAHPAHVRLLVAHGAAVDMVVAVAGSGCTALMSAAAGRELSKMMALINAGAARNIMTGSRSAIHAAVESPATSPAAPAAGNADELESLQHMTRLILQRLLLAGWDVDVCGTACEPALVHCARRLDVAAVRLLLSAGANPNITAFSGATPLSAVLSSIDMDAPADVDVHVHNRELILRLLAQHGADVNMVLVTPGPDPHPHGPDSCALSLAVKQMDPMLFDVVVDAFKESVQLQSVVRAMRAAVYLDFPYAIMKLLMQWPVPITYQCAMSAACACGRPFWMLPPPWRGSMDSSSIPIPGNGSLSSMLLL